MAQIYKIYPVGIVRKNNDAPPKIDIHADFADALLGVDGFSHLMVLYWFNENDAPEKRNVLRIHPRRDKNNPLTGVFGTRSPLRPNLIAVSCCKLLALEKNTLVIDRIDAFDGTPVIDIKPYIPVDELASADVKVPDWV